MIAATIFFCLEKTRNPRQPYRRIKVFENWRKEKKEKHLLRYSARSNKWGSCINCEGGANGWIDRFSKRKTGT
jgi:hypothetical protein